MYLLLEPRTLQSKLRIATKKLQNLKFDSIAYTGNSGALFAIPLAIKLKKNIIIIRKPGEKSHGIVIEKMGNPKKCLIVDDFITTGATIRRLKRNLKLNCIEVKAVLLYNSDRDECKFENNRIIRC